MSIAKSLVEKGKQEEKERVAINMRAEGQSIAFISKVTGLPEAKVEKLQGSMEIKKH